MVLIAVELVRLEDGTLALQAGRQAGTGAFAVLFPSVSIPLRRLREEVWKRVRKRIAHDQEQEDRERSRAGAGIEASSHTDEHL